MKKKSENYEVLKAKDIDTLREDMAAERLHRRSGNVVKTKGDFGKENTGEHDHILRNPALAYAVFKENRLTEIAVAIDFNEDEPSSVKTLAAHAASLGASFRFVRREKPRSSAGDVLRTVKDVLSTVPNLATIGAALVAAVVWIGTNYLPKTSVPIPSAPAHQAPPSPTPRANVPAAPVQSTNLNGDAPASLSDKTELEHALQIYLTNQIRPYMSTKHSQNILLRFWSPPDYTYDRSSETASCTIDGSVEQGNGRTLVARRKNGPKRSGDGATPDETIQSACELAVADMVSRFRAQQ